MITTYFAIINGAGTKQQGTLLISPLNGSFNYSSSIVASQTIYLQDTGNITASLVPTAYSARLTGHSDITAFQFDLSNVPDGSTVNACEYLVNYTGSANSTASYALNAATASYAVSGGQTNMLKLYNSDTATYYSISIAGEAGFEYLVYTSL